MSIETSERAKSEKRYFVQFLPANVERVQEMLDRQQSAREERAQSQEFTFLLDKEHGQPFFCCWSHGSGEVYEIAGDGMQCSCPDYTFRCAGNGLKCKHIVALSFANADQIRGW